DRRFGRYVADRSRPELDATSRLSAHLRYGQISPRVVAERAREAAPDADALHGFLEQLITRRELAYNFVTFAPDAYDAYQAVPAWARATLDAHRHDPREALPSDDDLEAGRTSDPAWNAAMASMRVTGAMHNHMRMYWGKRILAWSVTPEEGFARTVRLNDRWFLDGRDPNGYAGVAWCYGVHDRPWPERAVFGKVRSMTPGGLKRKGDPEAYVRGVHESVARERRRAGARVD
ncbi:MAG: deoxyribodipyrimidine photolyase, partial [Trueperaceae bacterium]